MIFGQFIQVIEKYGANDIAIFRLTGLVWVKIRQYILLPYIENWMQEGPASVSLQESSR